ncbi:phosphoribosyltransferase [Methanobacterium sp. VT]|uniref:Phosphoribosyltransferase n=2 Tax=Methanobacterium spitsbergense TaxID=2874285 RepID=A0A8T5UP57_9EURY|nr:phosphoribosyltransferase [Methanobacterium spitsbergense]
MNKDYNVFKMDELNNVVEIPEFRDVTGIFKDRKHAGNILADMLIDYKDTKSIIFGIPAGGVPVAEPIASKLNLNLDVAVVSKITLPWNTEAGYGAVAFDGTVELNHDVLSQIGLNKDQIKAGIEKTSLKIERRIKTFRGLKPFPETENHTVILVDDGIASGFTMLVAVEALKKTGANKIIIAVPTAHLKSLKTVSGMVDLVYCPNIRGGWGFAVAEAYHNWYDVSEDDVIEILK